jgi:two-component system cell cycle response regulator DivK
MTESKLKVLLVDDEPSLNQALPFTLESRGLECITAIDMSSGVTMLEGNDIAVVVTDVMMPGGERFKAIDSQEAGFFFIDYVKKRWPRLPIVCLSVIGDQARIRSLTKLGVRYLRKGETPLDTVVEVVTNLASGFKVRH